nr:HemK2/MTQ2 family protein methyltransferase [Nocardia pseudobrasiliensis]
MMLFCAPGVYRPEADTWLLKRAFDGARIHRGGRVLDICTGSGALAIAAARAGAAEVTAVDISRAAVASAWLNSRCRGLGIELLRGDFEAVLGDRRFDVVLANPPYVPTPPGTHTRGSARAWNAGPTGREILDRLCTRLPRLLSAQGVALIVHSTLADPDRTVGLLRDQRLKAAVVARSQIPFGPVLRERAAWLAAAGYIASDQNREDLVVIRADRTRA